MYKPYTVFLSLGLVLLLFGLYPFVVLFWQALANHQALLFGPQHIRSLVTGSVLLVAAFISFTLGIVADLVRINRLLLEDVLQYVKRIKMD